MERLGATLGEILTNPTPWTNQHCGRVGCLPCKSKEGSCKAVGITYQWRCNSCTSEGKTAVYCGESARSLWDRTEEHLAALKGRQGSSFLWKHWSTHHEAEETPNFSVKLTGRYRTSAERQIREALEIDSYRMHQLMNSKKEYGAN